MINYCLVPNRDELEYDAAQAIKWGTRAGKEIRTLIQIHQSEDVEKAAIANEIFRATNVLNALKSKVTHQVIRHTEGEKVAVAVMDLKPSDYLGTRADDLSGLMFPDYGDFATLGGVPDASKVRLKSAAKIVFDALVAGGAQVGFLHRINDKYHWVVRMYVVVQA